MSKYKCHCTFCDWSGDYEELRVDKDGFEVCPECWSDTDCRVNGDQEEAD